MSQRLDVSKMLGGGRKPRARGSDAGSNAGGLARVTSAGSSVTSSARMTDPSQQSHLHHLHSAAGTGLSAAALSDSPVALLAAAVANAHHHHSSSQQQQQPQQQQPQASPRGSKEGKPAVGFVLMKCLEILRNYNMPMHIQDIQHQLGAQFRILNDTALLNRLRDNPRVHFDPVTKLWTFVSPYRLLRSEAAILQHVMREGSLFLDAEVLAYEKNLTEWINRLLFTRQVRGVRAVKSGRCKVFSTESGLTCDLYAPPEQRCDSCKSLLGVALYARGPAEMENLVIDADVKALWHKVAAPCAEQLQQLTGQNNRRPQVQEPKRRKAPETRAPRVHRVANAHMYTSQDLADVLMEQAQNEGPTTMPC